MSKLNIHQPSQAFIKKTLEQKFNKAAIKESLTTEKLIEFLAQKITGLKKNSQNTIVVSFIGGAACGKTTLTKLLTKHLTTDKMPTNSFSTDDFLIGDRAYRRKHFEGKAPLDKYDFELMNQKIEQIKNNQDQNKKIGVPTYDGLSGVAIAAGEKNYKHQISPVDVLIIEGDFDQVNNNDLKIYLHLSDINRLRIRESRDSAERNDQFSQDVINNFNQRQRTQHEVYTLPAAETADLLIMGEIKNNHYQYTLYRRL